jgi:hypothetical protein
LDMGVKKPWGVLIVKGIEEIFRKVKNTIKN